jgi:hypothetical protein
MARRQHPEAVIHCAVVQHQKARGVPGVFYFHRANGDYRSKAEAAIMSGMG